MFCFIQFSLYSFSYWFLVFNIFFFRLIARTIGKFMCGSPRSTRYYLIFCYKWFPRVTILGNHCTLILCFIFSFVCFFFFVSFFFFWTILTFVFNSEWFFSFFFLFSFLVSIGIGDFIFILIVCWPLFFFLFFCLFIFYFRI